MFACDKYRLRSFNDFMFNKVVLEKLIHIAVNDNIPHLIISGSAGSGKKTIVQSYLEALYDSKVHKMTSETYEHPGVANKKKNLIVQKSEYHIVIKQTKTTPDKYYLQEIIKQNTTLHNTACFGFKTPYKTIVIYDAENLSSNSQFALRRTMEKYARQCRFVFVCNNLSKIFDPLRSRCMTFCVAAPTQDEIINSVLSFAIKDNIDINKELYRKIENASKTSLKRAIWALDNYVHDVPGDLPLDKTLESIVKLLTMTKYIQDNSDPIFALMFPNTPNAGITDVFNMCVKFQIYGLTITNVDISSVIVKLTDLLIINNSQYDDVCSEIITCACLVESNHVYGRRDTSHLTLMISGIISIFKKYRKYWIKEEESMKEARLAEALIYGNPLATRQVIKKKVGTSVPRKMTTSKQNRLIKK